ncbi:MAG: long-chain fatty acid--CoA ligase [Alphaproteobacteria bacterium]|nr:long-chain fatty acid--CoA ligase [Alphaproteobacteria bacterium]
MSFDVKTLAQLLHKRAEASPDHVSIRTKTKDGGDAWVDRTWAQLRDRADAIATGILTAIELADNDVVGLLGQTSEDWLACDFAALSVNLQTVPIYASLLPEEVGYCHVDTGIKLVIVDDKAQLAKVREMRKGFSFFKKDYGAEDVLLKHIVVIDPKGIDPADDWESLADLEARGRDKLAELAGERERRRNEADPHQIATYTYTSGTTGPPKAVIQTHDNHLSMARMVEAADVMNDEMRAGGLFLFLPLAHSFGRLIQFSAPYGDLPLVISSVPTLADDARATRPGFFPAAPRVYEKMKAKIESAVAGAPPLRQKLFRMAIGVGEQTIPYRCKGEPVPGFLAFKYSLADKVVLSKLRARLGMDRAQALLSGSAPLDPTVHTFFLAMGLDLLEGYGLTETCPALSCNTPGHIKIGTVGLPLPGVTIKIDVTDQASGRGEILAKGPNITQGYLNRPEATAAAIDEDGWFHTGDEGLIDADGFVKITGRIKELIKTSGGKYVAPAKIEGMLKGCTIIQEAVVIGDRRNYCVALISIDTEELQDWAKQTGNAADQDSPEVLAHVQAHLATVNADLASFESIKYVKILPEPLSIDNGLLTASLKVKRNVVEERYKDLIDGMYTGRK